MNPPPSTPHGSKLTRSGAKPKRAVQGTRKSKTPSSPSRARASKSIPEPPPIRVRIVARRLPGRSCGPYTEVTVTLPDKSGHPSEIFPADVREAQWETELRVLERAGGIVFRGPSVNGRPGEQFLYLTWVGRLAGAAPAMFRRAKLRLDAVPREVLAQALESGQLVGSLELTARDGMPVCASVLPPAMRWSSD